MTVPVALRLELPEAEAGQPIAGRLELTNTGEEPFVATSPLSPAALSLVVFDRLWNQVQPSAVGKVHVAERELELPPGATQTVELPDLAFVGATAGMAYALEPGRYHVVAVYHPPTDPLPDRAEFPTAVSSNVATISVR